MWVFDTEKNLAMSCLPKNGSQSLRSKFKSGVVANEEALNFSTRVVWLREPLDRLVSNYSFFKTINEMDCHRGRPNLQDTDSWESFIDFVLDGNENIHWNPQVEQLTLDGNYLGTVTHKFEDITKLWGTYYRGRIPHMNGCVHEPTTTYRLAEIEDKYKEDFDLWRGL